MLEVKNSLELAQEASVETDPEKLLSLIYELNQALSRERRSRRKPRSAESTLLADSATGSSAAGAGSGKSTRP